MIKRLMNLLNLKIEFKNQYTQIFAITTFSLVVMMIIRIIFYFKYKYVFYDLTFSEILLSFFFGFRVDIITLFTFLGIFIILLALPTKLIYNKYYKVSICILWSIILNIIIIFSISDMLYFEFSQKHISNEILALANDTDMIFEMAFNSFLPYTIVSLFLFIFISYLIFKILLSSVKNYQITIYNYFYLFLILILIFLGIRNSFSGKSFGISDAYAVPKISSGTLSINGFFSFYRTLSSYNGERKKFMDFEKSLMVSKKFFESNKMNFISNEYPIQRAKQTSEEQKKYNILIVLLESFGAEHIDGFTKYEELNITPFFKKLSNEGLKYTNFYANGYRSIYGITSIYTGITLPIGFKYLGSGLEISNLSYLGNIAKENGYKTIAMQSANRRSYRVDSVSFLSGFEQYYGAEDMPNVEEVDIGRFPKTGTYDYNMFDFMHKKLNKTKEPFLSFMFTSTTHPDYYLPQKKFERFPHDLSNYNGYLNSLIYADNAIERFMNNIKNEPWFDNTIFIFTSDHGSGNALNTIGKLLRPNSKNLSYIEHFRIPLIIYAPKIFKPKTITTLGSQNDILPTIVDLLNFKQSFSVMGNSLFDESVKNRFVYTFLGDQIGLIKNDCFIMHNFKEIVNTNCTKEKLYDTEEELKALDTLETELLIKNKWYKKEKN